MEVDDGVDWDKRLQCSLEEEDLQGFNREELWDIAGQLTFMEVDFYSFGLYLRFPHVYLENFEDWSTQKDKQQKVLYILLYSFLHSEKKKEFAEILWEALKHLKVAWGFYRFLENSQPILAEKLHSSSVVLPKVEEIVEERHVIGRLLVLLALSFHTHKVFKKLLQTNLEIGLLLDLEFEEDSPRRHTSELSFFKLLLQGYNSHSSNSFWARVFRAAEDAKCLGTYLNWMISHGFQHLISPPKKAMDGSKFENYSKVDPTNTL